MNRPRLLLYLVLAVLVCVWAGPALAVDVVEAWRSPLGEPHSVSVNASDGSAWVAAASGVLHIAADGTVLSQIGGFSDPFSVAADPGDGSIWVFDGPDCVAAIPPEGGALVHLDASGTELLRLPLTLPIWYGLAHVPAVNPVDGSCWITGVGGGQIAHLARDGTELWRGGDFGSPAAISVNPTDNSVWVADHGYWYVVHLAEDGTELWRGSNFNHPNSVSVDPNDGSCWVAHYGSGPVTRLAADGSELLRLSGYSHPLSVSVDPNDGSCWVAEAGAGAVVHVATDGTQLWRGTGFVTPRTVAVDPTDGSCWVTDNLHVVHLSAEGEELSRMAGFSRPFQVSVNPADGSCWVADNGLAAQVVHLAEDGTQLWRSVGTNATGVSVNPSDGSCWVGRKRGVSHLAESGDELWAGGQFYRPHSLSANPVDGSCWVADWDTDSPERSDWSVHVVHLDEDGTELWRQTEPSGFGAVSVNPTDGSCWAAAVDLIHFAEDGSELWRGSEFGYLAFLSVNTADGSCWVSDCNNSGAGDPDDPGEDCGRGEIVRLADDGSELWRGGDFLWQAALSANPTDGSCWVASPCDGYVALLGADGSELWRGEGLGSHPWGVSVNPADGSCWVADVGTAQVVHLVIVPFQDIPPDFWAHDEVSACADAGIVSGYGDGTYEPSASVDRAQMAVYIARALAGGEESVPEFAGAPTFPDLPETFWALDHVEYAAAQNVVEGYEDGLYHPDWLITRDQMAVYVARALVAPEGDAGLADYVPAAPRNFPDVASNFWAYTAIEYCVEHGVVQGYEDGLYHPETVVTRDQMAVYIARAFGLTA